MFSKLKAGLQKAGNNFKSGMEAANRSMKEARSQHATPEKKKSELKSTPATAKSATEEKKPQTATTAAATERQSASAAPTPRASSVRSERSTKPSLHSTATPGEAPSAPRSRTSTPAPPPPPPPPVRTPKRASERPPSPPAAAPPTATVPAPARSPSPVSTTSGESLRFSEADDAETPGSVRFTVEAESAPRKPSTPPPHIASAAAQARVPAAGESEEADAVTADLTAESSLDIQVEDDEVKSNASSQPKEAAAATVDEKKASAKPEKTAAPLTKEPKKAAKVTPAPAKNSAKEKAVDKKAEGPPSQRTSTAPSRPAATKEAGKAPVSVAARGTEGNKESASARRTASQRRATPLRARIAGRLPLESNGAPKTAEASKGSKSGVRFADEKDKPDDDDKRRATRGARDADAKLSRKQDSETTDDGSSSAESEAQERGSDGARSSPPNSSGVGSVERDDEHEESEEEAEQKHSRAAQKKTVQRRRGGGGGRGFRPTPERHESDDSDDVSSEDGLRHAPRSSNRSGEGKQSRRDHAHKADSRSERGSARSRHHARDESAESRRDFRGRTQRDSSVHDRHERRHRDVEDLERDFRRLRPSRGATPPPPPPLPASRGRRGSVSRLSSLQQLDAGALVEECLRDTADYARGPLVRRRNSSLSRGSDHGDTVQRRSAVRTTYQEDFPDWSRSSDARSTHRAVGYEEDYYDGHDTAGRHGYGAQAAARHVASSSQSPYRLAEPPSRGSSSFHRLSFYDEDDALAAEAVAEPSRFRAHSAQRHRRPVPSVSDRYGEADEFYDDDYDASGGEQAMPRRYSRPASAERRRGHDAAGQRGSGLNRDPSSQSLHDWRYGAGRRPAQRSERHRYDAPRPRSPPGLASQRRWSLENDLAHSEASSWRRLTEDREDPDYYFSDAPPDRHSSAPRQSRPRGGAFAPSPPRSPLWARRGSFSRAGPERSARPTSGRLQTSPRVPNGGGAVSSLLSTLSPLRGRRAASTRASARADLPVSPRRLDSEHNTSARSAGSGRRGSVGGLASARSEEELLEEVEWKLDALGEQIAEEDYDRELAMRRSTFDRLYHLNNRRDRDERRRKVFELNRLERIRDRIVSGSLEEDVARREERRRKQQEMLTDPNGVFVRLYQNTSGRRSKQDASASSAAEEGGRGGASRHSTPRPGSATRGRGAAANASSSVNATAMSKASSRPGSARRRTLSREERAAMCDRLYAGAATIQRKREEAAKETVEERRNKEVEDLLIARLVGQLQLAHSRLLPKEKKAAKTLAELEAEARSELEKLRKEDPTGYEEKLLRGRVLSAKEQGRMSARLTKQGLVTKEALAERKAQDELRHCTFQPEVNSYAAFGKLERKDRQHGSSGRGNSGRAEQSGDGGDEATSDGSARRARHGGGADRCKELYRKGMKAKAREAELREEHDREARLRILRGRMASDHHFRRRVELDPSLAERFMKSLVV